MKMHLSQVIYQFLRFAQSITRDLARIASWCDEWGMKLNPLKSKSIVFNRSRATSPTKPDPELNDSMVGNFNFLRLLGVILRPQTHIRGASQEYVLDQCAKRRSSAQMLFNDVTITTFYSFFYSHFEYCSIVCSLWQLVTLLCQTEFLNATIHSTFGQHLA